MRSEISSAAIACVLLASASLAQVPEYCTSLKNVSGDGIRSIECINKLSAELKDARAENVSLAKRIEAIESRISTQAGHDYAGTYAVEGHDHNDVLPAGAVVLFAENFSEGGDDQIAPCPPGWSLYQEAAGRFAIGAGLPDHENMTVAFKDRYSTFKIFDGKADVDADLLPYREDDNGNYQFYEPGDAGGAEEVRLTEGEMPRHRHATSPPVQGIGLPAPWQAPFGASDLHPGDFSHTKEGIKGFAPLWASGQQHKEVAASSRYPLSDWAGGIDHDDMAAPDNNMPPYIALYFCKKNP